MPAGDSNLTRQVDPSDGRPVIGLWIEGSTLYWTRSRGFGDLDLFRSLLPDGPKQSVVKLQADSTHGAHVFAVQAGRVYWGQYLAPSSETVPMTIMTSPIDGTSSQEIAKSPIAPVVSSHGVYFIDATASRNDVRVVEPNGGSSRLIKSSLRTSLVGADDRFVYWVEDWKWLWRGGSRTDDIPLMIAELGEKVHHGCVIGDDLLLFGHYPAMALAPRAGGQSLVLRRADNPAERRAFAAIGADENTVYWLDTQGDYWSVPR